jgi:hypothetical protein
MSNKKCYACGSENFLREIKKVKLKTHGYLVPVKKGFICNDCKWRIQDETKKSSSIDRRRNCTIKKT